MATVRVKRAAQYELPEGERLVGTKAFRVELSEAPPEEAFYELVEAKREVELPELVSYRQHDDAWVVVTRGVGPEGVGAFLDRLDGLLQRVSSEHDRQVQRDLETGQRNDWEQAELHAAYQEALAQWRTPE